MKLSTGFLGAILLIIYGLVACNQPEDQEISYAHNVQPIFNTTCLDCHFKNGSANLDLTSYDALMSGESNNGPVVVAGRPDESLLFEKISEPQPSLGERMPLGRSPLPDSEINIIETWIYEGAQDN